MKRREATIALVALGVLSFAAKAQPQGKSYRIGFLGLSSPSDYAPNLNAFLQGLRELGYEDGRNIAIEYRWAGGRDERLPELAAQLARLNPNVIVTHATGVRAAQEATSTIPIVMGVSADPVGLGLIKSLAKPGGNTTGVASQMVDLSSKRLELLASNIANAATPGYKARDIDFKASLQGAMGGRGGQLDLVRTAPRHLPVGNGAPAGAQLKYRGETQSSVDGNTVDMDVERAAFAENAVQYEAGITFINLLLRQVQSAMQSQ